ncbi:DUF1990 domain-containing protein [Promicromonospora sp. NPDC050262]|uniref:DUF1990 family protein n=1 Tax=Promicromonospora sp. NPDC050262 TaxID=3155036 RepID=UPI0033D49124
MGRTAEKDGARWLGVNDGVARATVEVAIRSALTAQRDRLALLQVDIASDDDWPADLRATVRLAERRLLANPRSDISLTLDPRVDQDFEIALALAPFSICCTGIGTDGKFIWDANDTGTSAAFALTAAEELAVRTAIAGAGGDPDDLVGLVEHHLSRRTRNYSVVGATAPATKQWHPPAGWRAYEHTVQIGSGDELWDAASAAVLSWGIKTRSGFAVDPPLEPGQSARPGERYWLIARIGVIRVREPVEIITTVSTDNRAALAYGTLEGHPVSGEEAFIVHQDDDGTVSLTLRSLTRAGRGVWRGAFPVILVAQRIYRRRYLRVLLPGEQ